MLTILKLRQFTCHEALCFKVYRPVTLVYSQDCAMIINLNLKHKVSHPAALGDSLCRGRRDIVRPELGKLLMVADMGHAKDEGDPDVGGRVWSGGDRGDRAENQKGRAERVSHGCPGILICGGA